MKKITLEIIARLINVFRFEDGWNYFDVDGQVIYFVANPNPKKFKLYNNCKL